MFAGSFAGSFSIGVAIVTVTSTARIAVVRRIVIVSNEPDQIIVVR